MVDKLSEALQADNSRFDKEKFISYIAEVVHEAV